MRSSILASISHSGCTLLGPLQSIYMHDIYTSVKKTFLEGCRDGSAKKQKKNKIAIIRVVHGEKLIMIIIGPYTTYGCRKCHVKIMHA